MSTDHTYKTTGEKLYILFKYSIYTLLSANIYFFFVDDYAAAAHTFSDGVTFSNVIEAFTATIDTVNWVVLLLLFELETWVISDEVLEKKGVKWILTGIKTICYVFLVYALYGYFSKFFMLHDVAPLLVDNVCNLVDGELAFVVTMDEYIYLTAENCAQFTGQQLFSINGQSLFGNEEGLSSAQGLAWCDIINASSWLIVVFLLEADVWLQLKGLYEGMILRVSTIAKIVLYSALVGCAVYWGVLGSFLDFWDAFLWIVAFVFIEMNLFQWHQETTEAKEAIA
ncbi:hypothetical protein [Pseudemcibacter aquimaris]|uniref:hypothetical protein n=1 Tax=Pseudemcibacter aquimaris TaxID=2857064 RepID=UPI0020133D0C|nr:hypothetical protein [Pseudemcibacter aquimaris]MCC3862108.1 hypothetical protein [Pseudemcibacter aquimaris]WDU58861.1 hypothetical protein KW060_01060 [Pseudemcibacter aquimaris]